MNVAMPIPQLQPVSLDPGVRVEGKFFFSGEQKFFLKGVTYGTFRQASHGAPFPEKWLVERDFESMLELGANCIRTFTVPPEWLLDLATDYGLRVMVGIPWPQHVCFLDSPSMVAQIRRTIRESVEACGNYPSAFAYLIGNEIPPDIVRWHGAKRVQEFLKDLFDDAKEAAPEALISYANFPSTEYLDIDFTDFVAFNVYLHREEDFRHYLSHLHNLAENRPLVLTEFGMDSIREGPERQAATLAWQVRASFEMGVAGAVVFAWTDDWYAQSDGGFQVEDWAFGLVDRKRQKKPAFAAVRQYYSAPLPPPLPEYPRVSVVVCAYNAEATMNQCLVSLKNLNYPNYEVIVVNDGSTDRTRQIAERYGFIRLINQENRGLSAARNVGIAAATGAIIAFTDSDCMADPDWLHYLVAKFLSSDFGAIGGPNLPPQDDSLVASCVAVSPGGPTHVLLDDEVAEHIPGCNMAFRKEALDAIVGFDPLFRAAGDDVDLCWRLQNKGYTIGFSPAAMVWHFRRNTVKDYVKQQMGYGKAEALLYFKHPQRFNMLGQSRWFGRIYGDLSSFLFARQPRIYSGVFGRGMFQTLYQPPASLLSCLPVTSEWNIVALLLLGCAVLFGGYFWLGLFPLIFSLVKCATCALKAPIDSRFRGFHGRLLVGLLIYLGPLMRGLARTRWRMKRKRQIKAVEANGSLQKPRVSWHQRAFFLSYWTEAGVEKESLLYGIADFLVPRKYLVALDQGWSGWDLEICQSVWARAKIKVGTENHGGQKNLLKVQCALRMSRLGLATLCGYLLLASWAVAADLPFTAVAVGLAGYIHALAILYQKIHLSRVLYHALEIVAKGLHLLPVEETGPDSGKRVLKQASQLDRPAVEL